MCRSSSRLGDLGYVSCRFSNQKPAEKRIPSPWQRQESRNRACMEVEEPNARSAAAPRRRHVDTALNDVGIADPWPESFSLVSPSRPFKTPSNGAYGSSLTAKW